MSKLEHLTFKYKTYPNTKVYPMSVDLKQFILLTVTNAQPINNS